MKKIPKLIMISMLGASAIAGYNSMAGERVAPAPEYDGRFSDYPVYSGDDLELKVDSLGTHFTLWSPGADKAEVLLYEDGMHGAAYEVLEMDYNPQYGIWRADVDKPLYGKYYTFRVTHHGTQLPETPGVWAKAVGVNGKRAAIIKMSGTNPKHWCCDKGPVVKNFTDVVIYEMHHRDYSMHPSSGIANKGKFLALTEKGSVSSDSLSTGLDHLKELGITHVHILPSYDYNSVDEANLQNNVYNWGYDPQNYNVPEGSYSTNPGMPSARIKEFKQMVKTLHENGIGVIMDVVYNHTAENDGSNFELTAPGYYHRHWSDGRYSDASGCGNETASEREQMRNYIVESVKYWAKEYHIDGFRFDLMGIHDLETMNLVASELKKINPSIFIYGEGWTAGDSPLPVEKRAVKDNVSRLKDVAVFSDDIRDGVKGHYSRVSDRGFASGATGLEETVKIGIVASTAHPQVDYSKGSNARRPYADSPEMIVNYVSCHDDMCLTDKLRASMPEEADSVRQRVARLAQTIVFTSQGTPFMFAGEELWRDKKGVHNSYKSPDPINAIDWELKKEHSAQFEYYKELIALRKSHPAFRMTSAEQISKHLKFDKINNTKQPNLISYSLTDHANGDEWKEIKVIFNGADKTQKIKLSRGTWHIVARDAEISADGNLGTLKGGNIEVAPYSALILWR